MRNRGGAVLLIAAVAVFSLALAGSADVYYRMLFERAVFLLETRILPIDAIPIFQEIINRHSSDRYYAARAQLYLGLCYKRIGSDEASPAFREVVKNFADQGEVVKIAAAELAHLNIHEATAATEPKGAGPSLLRRFPRDYKICDLSRDGRYFVLIDRKTGRLMIYDTVKQAARRLTPDFSSGPAAGFAERAKLSPDAGRVVYSWRNERGETELRIVGIDGSGPETLVRSKEIMGIHPAGWTLRGDRILAVLLGADLRTRVALVSPSDQSIRPL
ncbi:MAG: hypothetical protein OEW18_01960, partial [Candidatus Aminicenantes bacterium]|nr:hypothetical protein [Candidatus Aminicenantes bacterium]